MTSLALASLSASLVLAVPTVARAARISLDDRPSLPPPQHPDLPPRNDPEPPEPDTGLFIAGTAVLGAGFVMGVAGGLGVWAVSEFGDFDLADPAFGSGRAAFGLAITGGVAATVGIPLLVVGVLRLKRSSQRLSVAPYWNRRAAGVSMRLRF